jgi:glyoxylase-like metal-dependent hydrolase (beta-lactamase superfamily II)
MVSILKNKPIDGVKIVPCRVNGPRGIVKSFLVSGDERLILVDTGFSDSDADIIVDAIVEMGRKHSDLKLCVLTHRHGDHTGGLKKLKKTLKFEVLAHELDVPAIQKSTGHDVEHVVKGGERLPDCGDQRSAYAGAHRGAYQPAFAAHQDDDRRRRYLERGRASRRLAGLSFFGP